MVKKQRNNQAIFGPFLDFEVFFKNRGLSFETSDSGFRDLLDELFPMVEENFQLDNFAQKPLSRTIFLGRVRLVGQF